MTVTIHLCKFPFRHKISNQQAALLPPLQRSRFNELKGTRAISFFWSRAVLLQLLTPLMRGSVGCEWNLIEQEALPPRLNAHQELELPSFSISHSGDRLAIALATPTRGSGLSLGIDVERLTPVRPFSIATMFCNQQQMNAMENLPVEKKMAYMIKLWTQKEAWFKKSNTPILNSKLKNISFSTANNGVADIHTTLVDDEYYLSIASDLGTPDVVLNQVITTNSPMAEISARGEKVDYCWQSYRACNTE